MPAQRSTLAGRIGRLAAFLAASDAVRVRIERDDEEIELARSVRPASLPIAAPSADGAAAAEAVGLHLDAIKADLVGIFRLSRPAPVEGEALEADRELGFIEALGIRNPVHSLGTGRIVSIEARDGAAVEYGQSLFLLDRG